MSLKKRRKQIFSSHITRNSFTYVYHILGRLYDKHKYYIYYKFDVLGMHPTNPQTSVPEAVSPRKVYIIHIISHSSNNIVLT